MTKKDSSEQGLIMVVVIVMVTSLMLIGLTLISQTTSQFLLTSRSVSSSNAIYTAEAGIEQSVQALNANNNFAGYPTAQVFFNNVSQGYATYTATITAAPGNANAKVITSTGNVYKYQNHSRLISSRTVQVTVVGTTSEGYSVYSGPGGLILTGSANITNSSIYVGGTLTLTGSAKIGTAAKPLDVDVAHVACPPGNAPGASYPQQCGSGTQPISMAQSTAIYGSVCATNQTSTGPNNNIKTGTGGQGLIAGCVAPAVTQPVYDRAAHIASMTTTAASNDNTYVCRNSPFNRTWPNGLRLNGNVVIDGSCNITLRGNVYINGTLTIGGAATIKVDNSVGTVRPVILADGIIDVRGSTAITANASGTSTHLISFASNAACGSTCTNLTGNALKLTSTYETIQVGGAANVPGVIFQAYWGQATIGGSGNIGAAVGQTVSLSGAGTVTFGTNLSTGVSTWTISSYQIKYP